MKCRNFEIILYKNIIVIRNYTESYVQVITINFFLKKVKQLSIHVMEDGDIWKKIG